MGFDYTSKTEADIEFGVVLGNEKIVFIKAGLGGNYMGYDEKYLKIARRLNEKYGCSVISVSNPQEPKSQTDIDKGIIEEYVRTNNIDAPTVFFFGHSNGGIKGLELSAAGIKFKSMVLSNMPLMINIHKTLKYIAASEDTAITAVYGQYDPSFPYIPFIRNKFNNLKIVTVPSADHHFKGLTDEFIGLSDLLMS